MASSSRRATRPGVGAVPAAAWAYLSMLDVRRRLRRQRVDEIRVRRPPPLPPSAARGALAALRRGRATCLERSLVLQAWHAAHGSPRQVVIGVTAPGSGFLAHAWLDGEHHCEDGPFEELLRLPPR